MAFAGKFGYIALFERVRHHAHARTNDIRHNDPDYQCQRSNYLEIQQRLRPLPCPTFFKSPIPTIPSVIVRKMIGLMKTLTTEINPSPSHFHLYRLIREVMTTMPHR